MPPNSRPRGDLHFVRSFDDTLVCGVASYALELFRAVTGLDAVYVPIGMGSGICGVIAVRDALGLKTEVIGVVASGAPAYALSFAAGRPVEGGAPETIADGMACRVPDPDALEIILRGASRMVTVSDEEIRAAMRHLFSDTHNVAEGAGAAALAASASGTRPDARPSGGGDSERRQRRSRSVCWGAWRLEVGWQPALLGRPALRYFGVHFGICAD